MKTHVSFLLVLLALILAPRAAAQSRYAVGNTVANFTLTDRATGRPVQLTDFAGKVVVLEWFAWWCPFCQAAASQVGPGIVQYYVGRGGNNAKIPVLHVSVNLQPGQEAETQQFINRYGLGQVLNDFDRGLANRFQSGGQPIFAIINGVAGSTSHKQWELVFSQLGYGSTQAPINDLRNAIDSVRAASAENPVTPPVTPPTVALSFVIQPQPLVVTPGTPVTLNAAATGAGTPLYQWFRDGVSLAGATSSEFSLPAAALSDAGLYTVRVTAGTSVVTSTAARLTVNPVTAGLTNRLGGLSVLTSLAADQELTVGFDSRGGAKPLLIRAAGPSLGALGVPGTIADPRLTLFNGTTAVVANDNWAGNGEVAAAVAAQGAFAFTSTASLDAALVLPVDGARSVKVAGRAPGAVIVEVYDAGAGNSSRLTSVSALHQVGPGSPVLTAGFTINGTGTKTVLIRAVGPSLAQFAVPGFLSDPKLALFSTAGPAEKIAENDTWAPGLADTFSGVGAFPYVRGSLDAALVATLAPGGYTVQAGPSDGTEAGAVLIEVYELP